jgi:hypothetical protein
VGNYQPDTVVKPYAMGSTQGIIGVQRISGLAEVGECTAVERKPRGAGASLLGAAD